MNVKNIHYDAFKVNSHFQIKSCVTLYLLFLYTSCLEMQHSNKAKYSSTHSLADLKDKNDQNQKEKEIEAGGKIYYCPNIIFN